MSTDSQSAVSGGSSGSMAEGTLRWDPVQVEVGRTPQLWAFIDGHAYRVDDPEGFGLRDMTSRQRRLTYALLRESREVLGNLGLENGVLP